MRISFVIPSLNQGAFLSRCIQSCLDQGVEDFEILVQDGGSTDDSLQVLESFGRAVSWVSEKDRGQSDAVNRAVGRASGEIVAWINSDDYYADDHVLKGVERRFASNPQLDVVFGDGVYVNSEGVQLQTYRAGDHAGRRDRLISYPSSPLPQPAVFFKRETFHRCGGLNTELHLTMDYELWLRLFATASAWEYWPRTLACMTVHEGAKSTRLLSKQIVEIRSMKLEYLRNNSGTLH